MPEILSPWQDLITLKERIDRLITLTGHHRRVFEATNIRQDCNLDCLNCRMHDNLREFAAFTEETLAVLRAYRSRIHRADEDEEGTNSDWHTVYGVHRQLIDAADKVYSKARRYGLLSPLPREYGV